QFVTMTAGPRRPALGSRHEAASAADSDAPRRARGCEALREGVRRPELAAVEGVSAGTLRAADRQRGLGALHGVHRAGASADGAGSTPHRVPSADLAEGRTTRPAPVGFISDQFRNAPLGDATHGFGSQEAALDTIPPDAMHSTAEMCSHSGGSLSGSPSCSP